VELQELHGELDVRQRASPELQVELASLAGRDALAFDARLHAAHLARLVLAEGTVVGGVLGDAHEPAGDVGIARDGPCLRQRLTLPDQAPSAVVGAVAIERARQRALAPLRPQPRVDAERLAFGR